MPAQFNLTPSSVQFFISADVDPGVISRVIELFSLRGIVPHFLKVTRYTKMASIPESLSIDIRASGLSNKEQQIILNKLTAIVCVQNVRKEIHFQKSKAA